MNKPVWTPLHPEQTNMYAFMRMIEKTHNIQLPNYQALHAWSIAFPEHFWSAVAKYFNVPFKTPPEAILKQIGSMFDAKWFEGATLNVAEILLTRYDNHPALICINEEGNRHEISYIALREQVAAVQAGLKQSGVSAGDRVAGFLPNNEYTIIAMLATASLGAIWSACSPDFGVKAATDRLSQIEPKVLFVADGYTYHGKTYHLEEKTTAITDTIPSIQQVVICPVGHMDWSCQKSIPWNQYLVWNQPLETKAYPFDHPWYILFSSGTTGQPKGIVHGTGGVLLQHLKELGLHSDLTAHDTLFFYTTCGWMMWNWMVSALALGTTLLLYDGSPLYPSNHRLFEIIAKENVTAFGTAARFLAAIEKRGVIPNQTLSFPKLKTIFSTGSPLLPEQYDFVAQHIKQSIQLSSISGGTDIVSCFALGNPITPVYRGELQCLGLGMDVQVFNDDGRSVTEETGELVCAQAFPCMPICFWGDDSLKSKYKSSYFERFDGIWAHGDMACITKHHGLIIYGRSDATLNPGGVRIGTAEIYRPLEYIPEVLDSIVIGQPWQGDVRIVLFVKLKEGLSLDEALKTKIKNTIRAQASPRHVPAKILDVPDIPRTISGKIVEVAARQTVQGLPVKNLGSLENPEALEYFKNRPELMIDATEST